MRSFLALILSFLMSAMGFLSPVFSSNFNDSLLYVVNLDPEMFLAEEDEYQPPVISGSTELPDITEEPDTSAPDGSGEQFTQTVMIYMVGSNLESEGGMATLDIQEIEAAGIDTDKNNVLLYTGGASVWQNYTVSPDKNMIFELTSSGFREVDSMDKANMGEPDALSDYMNWVCQNYSTDRYALVLWNHGGGPNVGYGCDENFYYDTLTLSEMSEALKNSPFNEENKLEWVSFDACLMASIEVAEVFSPYANYLIASQESEPGFGHDYSYLSCLNDGDATGDIVGKEVADTYMAYYNALVNQDPRFECDVTMSCMDLSQIETVKSAMDTLFTEAEDGISKGDFGEIVRCRTKTKAFGVFTTSDSYDLIDLYSLSEQLSGMYSASADLQNALEQFVVVNAANVDGAHGVSVYYPYDNYEYQDYWMSDYDNISPSEVYTRFLRTMTGEEPEIDVQEVDNPDTDVAYENVDWTLHYDNVTDREGDGFAIRLTDEQKAYFSSANCAILVEDYDEEEGNIYGMLAMALHVSFDENSEIYIPMDKYVVEMNNEAGDADYGGPIFVTVPETDRDIVQMTGAISRFGSEISDNEFHSIILNLKLSDDGKHYEVLQAITNDSDDDADTTEDDSTENDSADTTEDDSAGDGSVNNDSMVAEKQYIDIMDYSILSNYYAMWIPTYEDDGSMKIITEWDRSKWIEGREVSLDEGIKFTVVDVPEEDRDQYYCHFVVFDIYGNYHISDLVPLQ